MIRFLHCADLHIDRPFEGLHLLEDNSKTLAKANAKVLEKIVDEALSQSVDFVLLVGDTFHQNRPSLKTQHHFFQQMNRLKEAAIPVYLSFGNHDYYDPQRYWFEFPENVHLFTKEIVETFEGQAKDGSTYQISGFSYQSQWLGQSKVPEFPPRQSSYHIGMYHGDLNGDRYAPFSLQEMKQKNYAYWALGHIHVPTVLATEPPMLYPGAPQGHTQKETQTPGVLLVTLTPTQASWEASFVAEVVWQEMACSLKGVRQVKEALEAVEARFLSSEKSLVKITFTQTDDLPENWLGEEDKFEMIAYLNKRFAQKGFLQQIYQVELQANPSNRLIMLQGSRELREHLLKQYEATSSFTQVMEELWSHKVPSQLYSLTNFQADVLKQTKKRLDEEYQWRE